MRNYLIPIIFAVTISLAFGYQDAFAVNIFISDQATCENAPVLGDFQSGTCVLPGTHTIPLADSWVFQIDSKVTGTVNIFGRYIAEFTPFFSNSGTINVIGDTGGTNGKGALFIRNGADGINECDGIINLIAGTGSSSGRLAVIGAGGFPSIFNNFGTINGINSNLASSQATVILSSQPDIVTFNNHGTLTAPVLISADSIFNDNLPNQCVPVGGTYIPIDQTALLLAGLTSMTVWMIPTVLGLAGVGVYLVKFRKH